MWDICASVVRIYQKETILHKVLLFCVLHLFLEVLCSSLVIIMGWCVGCTLLQVGSFSICGKGLSVEGFCLP